MKSHAEFIKPAEAPRLADLLGVSVHTVRSWKQRDSIPAEYWKALQDQGIATLDELAEGAAEKRAAQ